MQPAQQRRILCVDDDDDTCFLLTTLLNRENFETTSVSTITEALRLAERAPFDIFIIDKHFTDGTGMDMCRKLKASFPQTPLIVFSGDTYTIDREEAMRAGASAFVGKPQIDELVETVHRLLPTSDAAD